MAYGLGTMWGCPWNPAQQEVPAMLGSREACEVPSGLEVGLPCVKVNVMFVGRNSPCL